MEAPTAGRSVELEADVAVAEIRDCRARVSAGDFRGSLRQSPVAASPTGPKNQSNVGRVSASATRLFLRRYLVNLAATRPDAVRGPVIKQLRHKRVVDVIAFHNPVFTLIGHVQACFKLSRITERRSVSDAYRLQADNRLRHRLLSRLAISPRGTITASTVEGWRTGKSGGNRHTDPSSAVAAFGSRAVWRVRLCFSAPARSPARRWRGFCR